MPIGAALTMFDFINLDEGHPPYWQSSDLVKDCPSQPINRIFSLYRSQISENFVVLKKQRLPRQLA